MITNIFTGLFSIPLLFFPTEIDAVLQFWFVIVEFFEIMSAQIYPNLCFDADNHKVDAADNHSKPHIIPYEEKYWVQYNKAPEKMVLTREEILYMEQKTDSYDNVMKKRFDKLSDAILMEYTPLGNVIMYFDNENYSFVYFSDKPLPFVFLESVARKYVITFSCKPIYTMNAVTRDETKKIDLNVADAIAVEDGNVFAKFKKYKKSNEKTEPVVVNKNRYTYKGKLCNYSFIKIPPKTPKNQMTFSEFKNKNI